MSQSFKITLSEYKAAISRLRDGKHLSSSERSVLSAILTRDFDRRSKQAENRQDNLRSLSETPVVSDVSGDGGSQTELGASPPASGGDENDEVDEDKAQSDSPSPSSSSSPQDSTMSPNSRRPRQYDRTQHHGLSGATTGMPCPKCNAPMYQDKARVIVRVTADPPFCREQHFLETCVCKSCGYAKSADPGFDESALVSEFSPKAAASLMVFHYYLGLPFKRLGTLMGYFGRQLSPSKQWDVASEAAERLQPVFAALWLYAREHAISLRGDDSGARILNLKPPDGAVNTSALYFETPAGPVSLFTTGGLHFGDLCQTLARLRGDRPALVRVSDAASKNFVAEEGFIDACCNEHAFAYFRKAKNNHPETYAFVADIYSKVFGFEAECKKAGLSGPERLSYHQKHSLSLMVKLGDWAQEMLARADIEDNSDEGRAIRYLANHFVKLTEFLRTPDVPLDNNRVEQFLRVAKRYFKNSSFYKTQTGAEVGDIMMSLARTAVDAGVSPIDYFQWCFDNHADLSRNPARYFPWIFRDEQEQAARLSA